MEIPSNRTGDARESRGRPPARVGDRVRVRQRAWTVAGVEPFDDCVLLTLSSTDPHGGDAVRVLAPFDDVERDTPAGGVHRVGRRHWANVCRALIAADGPAGTLRVAPTANVDLLPYQLEPALALLHGHASRVLIADEVGLGKTVQAALAAAELCARGAAARILVIAPSGLRDQWADECRARFALPFAVLDQATLRRMRAALPVDVNPWTMEPLAVASVDYIKRPEVTPLVAAANWDVVIVDEAHGSAGPSDRHEAVSTLCRRSPYVLLLTATPHNGDDGSFTSLCGLGALGDTLLTFRRTRREVGRDAGRHVHTLRVRPSAYERRMHDALAALTAAMRHDGARHDRHRWLMLSVLHKRALSSPYALAESVSRRLRLLDGDGSSEEQQLLLPLDAGEHDGSDAPPAWSEPALRDRAEERRLLQAIAEAAGAALAHDSKLDRVRRLLHALREPAIVFTEYRDTLVHLQRHAAPQAALIHGGMNREQRRLALDEFGRAGLLLATDAAGEGLNLQRQCRIVVNLELPWNPMRLEQRIGRVDRIGQGRRVHAFHLVLRGSGEERIVDRLAARVSRADDRVGASDPFDDRPPWTEDDAVRLIVDGEDAIVGRPAPRTAAVPVTRLTGAADEACRRAALVRAASVRPVACNAAPGLARTPPPEGSPTLIAWSANRRTRAALRGHAIAICRTQLTDAEGRPVASHLSALVLPVVGQDTAWLQAVTKLDVPAQPGWLAWRDTSLRVHQQFAATAVNRARAIARALDIVDAPRQPGLFDRRAERSWTDARLARTSALSAAAVWLQRAEMSVDLTTGPVELVLLLLPRRPQGPL